MCSSDLCRGFGGIGGILCYQLDIRSFDEFSDDGEVYGASEDDGEVCDDSEFEPINSFPMLVQGNGGKRTAPVQEIEETPKELN